MSVIIGTSNHDGTGSSENLTADNGALISGYFNDDGITVYPYETFSGISFDSVQIQSDTWNNKNYKEAKVDGNYEAITIDNIIDLDIHNQSDLGFSHIELLNTKRGNIDTSGVDSDDSIFIGVYSNSSGWSNKFTIDTGEGNDSVTLANVQGSQYTRFDINLGTGDDQLDISTLSSSYKSYQERIAEGGDGFDVLITNGSNNVTFSGFEMVKGTGFNSTLSVTKDILDNNSDNDVGLIITNIDVDFSSALNYTTQAVDAEHSAYLEQHGFDVDTFDLVTVDDGEYTLLIQHDDLLS